MCSSSAISLRIVLGVLVSFSIDFQRMRAQEAKQIADWPCLRGSVALNLLNKIRNPT
jgi:hypothetical protein